MTKPKGVFKKRVNKGNRFYKLNKETVVNSLEENSAATSAQTAEGRPSLDKPPTPTSASKRKLSNTAYEGGEAVNVIFDLDLLVSTITSSLTCKHCNGSVTITEQTSKRIGLANFFTIDCSVCSTVTEFCNSRPNTCEDITFYEINTRLFYGMRCIGKGLTPTKILCGVLNLSPPLTKTDKLTAVVGTALKSAAEDSMKSAVFESVELSTEPGQNLGLDISIGFDSSWQKRGHVSKNAVATITSFETGKVLDVEVLTKYCHTCALKKTEVHDCVKNYEGSSGGMETAAAVTMFQRSLDLRGVRYTKFLGDGDSSAFKTVCDAKPYNVPIQKLECIGHIQKRMGCRLRKLKSTNGNNKLSDGKSMKGANRLTDSLIDKFQDYYGKAIRNNSNDVDKMTKAVWAIWFHRFSTDDKPAHNLCDKSWCGYLKAKEAKREYKHKPTPEAIMIAIKPIFKDLANKELLKKCLHGKTQNSNESFNNVVWSRVPKNNFVGKKMLEVGVWDAVCTFNDGCASRLHVLKKLGVKDMGKNTVAAMKAADDLRVKKAEIAVKLLTKEARIERRRKKLKLVDKESEKYYKPGGF